MDGDHRDRLLVADVADDLRDFGAGGQAPPRGGEGGTHEVAFLGPAQRSG
jgi:hypothetical protein